MHKELRVGNQKHQRGKACTNGNDIPVQALIQNDPNQSIYRQVKQFVEKAPNGITSIIPAIIPKLLR